VTDQTISPNTSDVRFTGHAPVLRVLNDLTLDPNGRFYNLVLAYLVASAGLTPVYDAEHYPDFLKGTAGIYTGNGGFDARVNLPEVVAFARDGSTIPAERTGAFLCCMLANTAHSSLSDAEIQRLYSNPTFQFFRHVRNAASHGNRWNLYPGQPSIPASWGAHTLDPSWHDKPCFFEKLGPADLLYLIRDIERLL
jgi:hypothetical protein